MKEKFAKMMIEGKLNFLPLEESLELLESGTTLTTEKHWVICTEEIEDNGDDMTPRELISAHDDIYGVRDREYLKVGDSYDEFDEFTKEICPAPTYIELIKN